MNTANEPTNAQTKISRALSRLVAKLPFYGALALSFPVKQTDTVPTAATDGTIIYINPAFIEPLSVAQTAFVLAHEAAHIAQLHCYRRKALNLAPRRYNAAADYAIHSSLIPAARKTGGAIDLPCDESGRFLGLYDEKYDGLSAEEIYRLLENEQDSGGEKERNTQDPTNPQDIFAGDVLPANTQDPTTEASTREKVKRALERAVQASKSKGVGDVPSWATAALEALDKPRLDWREVLRQFITTTRTPQDYTWSRPNRRYAHQKLILPSTEGQQTQPLGVLVDISGSVHHHIPSFLSELVGIFDQHPTEITLIFVDTEVQQTYHLQQHDIDETTLHQIAQKVPMGGGTDLRSGFRWFVGGVMGSTPNQPVDALIVLTDGETPWPNEDEVLSLPPTITIITPNGVKPPAYMGQFVKLED